MSYTINRYNGTQLATVEAGTIDTSLDIKLIGKSYAGYGIAQNENFVYLLENFSNNIAPPNPISGQIWYDSGNKKLKFYNGTKFRSTGVVEVSDTAPSSPAVGDFWFDTENNQLSTYNGTGYTLIGPQSAGTNQTEMFSTTVLDNNVPAGSHVIIKAVNNGNTVFIISSDPEFTLDNNANSIDGFTKIYPGVTLRDTNNIAQPGVTSTSHRFYGTATDADRLGGFAANNYVLSNNAQFTAPVNFADLGVTFGNSTQQLKISNGDNSTTPTIEALVNSTPIVFKTKNSISATVTPMRLLNADVLPGEDYATTASNLGSASYRWNNIYAKQLIGTADKADTLVVGAAYVAASTANVTGAASVVARDTLGNIDVTYMSGIAEKADKLLLGAAYISTSATNVANTVAVRDSLQRIYASSTNVISIVKEGTDGTGDIGQAGKKFGTVYANTFSGNVTGDVTGDTTGVHEGNVIATDSAIIINATTKTFFGNVDASTGRIYAGSGDATTPSITFSSETAQDSGLYWNADGYINFAINGQYAAKFTPTLDLEVVGNVVASVFHGTFNGLTADLAEMYLADAEYEVGTVMMIGGDKEVTASAWGKRAIGVVSNTYAYLMNSELEGGTAVALKGRVPVKVIGRIKKGDELIAADNGCAMMAVPHASGVFAVALQSSDDEGEKFIEALVL